MTNESIIDSNCIQLSNLWLINRVASLAAHYVTYVISLEVDLTSVARPWPTPPPNFRVTSFVYLKFQGMNTCVTIHDY